MVTDNHLILPKDLVNIAEDTLKILDENNIHSMEDLTKNIGKMFSIENSPENYFIRILERPSNQNTNAIVLEYNQNSTGIILNTVSNKKLDYSQIMVKRKFRFKDYQCFGGDQFRNKSMFKKIPSSDFSVIIEEIKSMKNIKNYFGQ